MEYESVPSCERPYSSATSDYKRSQRILPGKVTQSDVRLKPTQSLTVAINGYELNLSKAVRKIYKYELKPILVKKDGKEKDLTRGPKNDVAVNSRHRVLWELYMEMLKANKKFFGADFHKFFYDCGLNFYSIEKLVDKGDDGRLEFTVSWDQMSEDVRDFLGDKTDIVRMKILPCEKVFLRSTAAARETTDGRDTSTLQFLDVVLNQMIRKDDQFLLFRNKAFRYPRSYDRELSGGKVLGKGFEGNVRLVGESEDSAVNIVQIDAKRASFFKEQKLLDLVCDLCHGNLRNLAEDKVSMKKVAKQIKDMVVRTTHLPKQQREFCIFGLTADSANEVKFEVDGQTISVSEYFQNKYLFRLRHPQLPCVVERRAFKGGVRTSYHPIECLEVIRGQRVSTKKQTPNLVEEMIRYCRLLPAELKEENDRERRAAFITNDNPYLQALGITVSRSARTAKARVLTPPAIVYGDGQRIEPTGDGTLNWRLSGRSGDYEFFKPATPPNRWAVFVFDMCLDFEETKRFVWKLIQRARAHGIKMNEPYGMEAFEETGDETCFVRDKMEMLNRKKVQYVLFITTQKRDITRDCMKLAEVSSGVVTQHIQSETVKRVLNRGGGIVTLDGIVMKMNLKLGGITHALSSSDELRTRNNIQIDLLNTSWLRPSRMIIGFAMSHASPQSLYERQAGISPSEPTVVGMAFTCGDPYAMSGEYWVQEPGVTTIHYLKEHVHRALHLFKEESSDNSFPEHVVVFRGGVSDTEFTKVVNEEAKQMRNALEKAIGRNGTKIRLSIICVQTHSNYRLFRDGTLRGNAIAQNVPPGTCVDSSVVSPTHTEFILVPHKSIVGTARPIRCTVLVDDEPRMSLDELECLTNTLCYAHGIVTSPISLPAHLYSANDLAKRGRNNWKAANFAEEESAKSDGGEGDSRFQNDGSEDFFVKLGEELAPKLRKKFWA